MQSYKLTPVEPPTSSRGWPVSPAAAAADWVNEILDYMPKALRNRSQLVLQSLRGVIKLTPENLIIYADDGEVGSSIIALMHWVASPVGPTQERPADLKRFLRVLEKAGTPSNAYGKGKLEIVKRLLSDHIWLRI